MNDVLEQLKTVITAETVLSMVRAGIVLVVGLLLARVLSRRLSAVAMKRMDPQGAMLLRRGIFYTVIVLTVVTVMHELNFHLGVLLGTAGVLSVALGFASQTSASNVVSGLFLLGERAFAVGDVIRVGDTTGEVLSIDLLSVKLRTFDNLFVRVPNESVVKSQLTNLTRFPIRRLDLQLGVAYKEDLGRVREILLEVADRNVLCLQEPVPLIIFQGYGDSALNLQFSVWATRENFLQLRNTISAEVKQRFDAEGIEIPFPHRTLYTGSVTEPFPVRVVAAA